ncbi:MAG: accessory gene regulator B family protein [Bacilli bacterium]|nr:accessory gene regulator B family protein [Bacilli bacterium]MDD4795509.1 accessory gene regulator B family protein [Bacilli bacterium]
MKNLVVNKAMSLIIKENKYDDVKLQEIKYGLEAVYLNVSKLTIFFIINAFLGTFKEGILFLLFYVPLRSFSYGFHAKSSLVCWLLSGFSFVVFPYISTIISINIYFKLGIILFSLLIYYLYSPADTSARPIINKRRRLILKTLTLVIAIIYSGIIILNNGYIVNIISFALLYQAILITPLFYKIFNLQYNNYLNYGLN